MKPNKKRALPAKPLVVATVHTVRGWREATRLRRGEVDVIELRLDCLRSAVEECRSAMERLKVPLLLTARHPAEGGAGKLSAADRRALLTDFLPVATVIDVELRSVPAMRSLLAQAREAGVSTVVSFHDFSRTPSLAKLRTVVRSARRAGADVVKIATQLRSLRDLAVLWQLQDAVRDFPLATMGMGPLGRISRLVLATAGSRLNYGFLDRPQVPGQWPAVQLRQRLDEVLP